MSDQGFEGGPTIAQTPNNFQMRELREPIETTRVYTGERHYNEATVTQTARGTDAVTDANSQSNIQLTQLKRSLISGNLDDFGERMAGLTAGLAPAQRRAVLNGLQTLFRNAGMNASVIELNGQPILQIRRMVNAEGQQITGNTGTQQTITFRPGARHPAIRVTEMENGRTTGEQRSLTANEHNMVFRSISARLRGR